MVGINLIPFEEIRSVIFRSNKYVFNIGLRTDLVSFKDIEERLKSYVSLDSYSPEESNYYLLSYCSGFCCVDLYSFVNHLTYYEMSSVLKTRSGCPDCNKRDASFKKEWSRFPNSFKPLPRWD